MGKETFYGNKDIYYKQGALGAGGQAKIYSVEDRKGKEYALKLYKKSDSKEEDRKLFLREKKFHELLSNSQFAVKMVDYSITEMFIVLERLKDVDFVYETNFLEKITKLMFFYDILCDVFYVHSQGVAHNDIKIRNFLYDENNNIYKIADFGLACNNSCKILGSFYWLAPEVLKQWEKRVSIDFMQKADIWSLGICFYFVLTNGSYPFTEQCMEKWSTIDYKFSDNKFSLINKFEIKPEDIQIKLSPENLYMKPFLEHFFQIDPEKRIILPEAITFIHNLLMEEAKKKNLDTEYAKIKRYNLKHMLSMGVAESKAIISQRKSGSPKQTRVGRSKSPVRSSPKRISKARSSPTSRKKSGSGSFRRSRNNEN